MRSTSSLLAAISRWQTKEAQREMAARRLLNERLFLIQAKNAKISKRAKALGTRLKESGLNGNNRQATNRQNQRPIGPVTRAEC